MKTNDTTEWSDEPVPAEAFWEEPVDWDIFPDPVEEQGGFTWPAEFDPPVAWLEDDSSGQMDFADAMEGTGLLIGEADLTEAITVTVDYCDAGADLVGTPDAGDFVVSAAEWFDPPPDD